MSRIEQKAVTREKVLKAAADLFLAHGYEEVSVRNVAKAAGVSTGSIFSNAKGKDELYLAATGLTPPDVRAFLDKIIHADPHEQVGDHLQEAAATLKAQLFGAGL